jgi:acetyl-CoA acetyltransferase
VTDVAVVGFAQAPNERHSPATTNGVEMLVPIFHEVFEATGLAKDDIGFWCSGSSDYLAGRAFSFVSAVDAIGAFPPVMESHVEMDGAWALYEAWLKIRTGEAEIALAYGFGKSSAGTLRRVLALQLDPYLVAPLWPDSVSIAALQARLGIEAGLWDEADMAWVAARSRASARTNPLALISGDYALDDLLDEPYVADPLRGHDCAPVTDGAAVVILAGGDRARELCERPSWISGFEHRIDSAELGARDLTSSPSATSAGPRWPSCTRRSRTRRSSCAGRLAWARTSPSTRPAAPCAGTRCSPPVWPGSAAPPRRSCPAAPTSRSVTRPAGRPCSRTWSA